MATQILDHPLIKHKISLLREKNTRSRDFRLLIEEITKLMMYSVTAQLPLIEKTIVTPLEETTGEIIEGKKLVFIPILRAGLSMLNAALDIVPNARVGHIGMARNEESLEPELYYYKTPSEAEKREFILLDPMLATGGSASFSIAKLKENGIKKISLACIIGAPEGIARLEKDHPNVNLYLAQCDRQLNEHGYILPGLGDAGDRIFGTL